MENIPYFNSDQVKANLTFEQLIPAIELALGEFSKKEHGTVDQPLRATASVKEHNGFLAAMPAYIGFSGALACKLVTFYPQNAAKNIPTHMATIIMFDEVSGQMRALMDGEVITAMRTAAASAVATKYLAEDVSILAVLGAGAQARSHIEAFCTLFSVKKLLIWNHRVERTKELAEEVKQSQYVKRGMDVIVCKNVKECVSEADVIITATFSTEPVLTELELKPWVHINSVGASRPQWQELGSELMKSCIVYVDSYTSANSESGDIIKSGVSVFAEIGEVVLKQKTGHKDKRTIFKSLGKLRDKM